MSDIPKFNPVTAFQEDNKAEESRRIKTIEQLLTEDGDKLTDLEQEVLQSIKDQELLSSSMDEDDEQPMPFGDRIADKVASFGGSWKFIITFFTLLFGWIVLNSIVLFKTNFDPYPFILLNLILSCIAAIQAPIIMMSQNRQEAKDRKRAEHDYKVNLKAELEVRLLHEKMDYLLTRQWQRLMELQKMQMDMLDKINNQETKGNEG
jgi:uncharacterized membrane protein